MNVVAIFIIGIFVTLLFAGATVLIVLSESADPEASQDSTLTRFERFIVGKKRQKAKREQAKHDQGE